MVSSSSESQSRIGYEWTALSVTTIGALMAAIDASAVLIALPSIMADLQASFITVMWVLLGYMLILAAVVPVVGRLADMLGARTSTTWALSSSPSGRCYAHWHSRSITAWI